MAEILECGNVDRGAACPHCAGHKTWLTRMRWAGGKEVQFWSCDTCRGTWSRVEVENADSSRD
jgi:DNA-directed RNA polymerase subunit M/transcription elongation factor TFIIS